MLSRLVITFLPRSKCLLISWLQSSAVILEPQKIKSDTVSTISPSISHEVMGSDVMILVFWMLSFKPIFSLLSRGFLVPLHDPYPSLIIRNNLWDINQVHSFVKIYGLRFKKNASFGIKVRGSNSKQLSLDIWPRTNKPVMYNVMLRRRDNTRKVSGS